MKDLIIAGVEVIRDESGRYNLNALHRASGGNPVHAPSQWLRLKGTQKLIDQLESETMQKCTVTIEGVNGGTFAHELLIVSYAGWISPAFQLKVNQAFLDMNKKDQDLVLPNFNDPVESARAWADAKEAELKALDQLEAQKPMVNYYDRVSKNESHMNATQVAQKMNLTATKMNKYLDDLGVYNKSIKRGRTFNHWFVESGYGMMKQSEAGYSQAVFTTKGEQYIIEKFTSEGII